MEYSWGYGYAVARTPLPTDFEFQRLLRQASSQDDAAPAPTATRAGQTTSTSTTAPGTTPTRRQTQTQTLTQTKTQTPPQPPPALTRSVTSASSPTKRGARLRGHFRTKSSSSASDTSSSTITGSVVLAAGISAGVGGPSAAEPPKAGSGSSSRPLTEGRPPLPPLHHRDIRFDTDTTNSGDATATPTQSNDSSSSQGQPQSTLVPTANSNSIPAGLPNSSSATESTSTSTSTSPRRRPARLLKAQPPGLHHHHHRPRTATAAGSSVLGPDSYSFPYPSTSTSTSTPASPVHPPASPPPVRVSVPVPLSVAVGTSVATFSQAPRSIPTAVTSAGSRVGEVLGKTTHGSATPQSSDHDHGTSSPAATITALPDRLREPERMPASKPARYYQNKQLPATPRLESLDTLDVPRSAAASSSEPSSARTPASATAASSAVLGNPNPLSIPSSSNPTLTSTGLSIYVGSGSAPNLPPLPPLSSPITPITPLPPNTPLTSGPTSSPAAAPAPAPSVPSAAAIAAAHERRLLQHAAMLPEGGGKLPGSASFSRTESQSSNSGLTTLSSRTLVSSTDAQSGSVTIASSGGGGGGQEHAHHQHKQSTKHARPFVVRNGRTFVADPTLPYPLPVDLAELHRQSLRTLLLFQLFGGPVCSPAFANRPPQRVLEVGCGSGFWSMMCYRYYARHGHTNISFTGIDIAPIAPGATGAGTTTSTSTSTSTSAAGKRASTSSGSGSGCTTESGSGGPPSFSADGRPDKDMRWRFVQHDLRRTPWPFQDEEFDLVMVKDMSLASPINAQQELMDEYLRVLVPGGTIEIWESDHTIRLLRPHVPEPAPTVTPTQLSQQTPSTGDDGANSPVSDVDEIEAAANLGAYVMTANTPLSAPLNNFLVEYNGWLSKALEARSLSAVPCTLIGPLLVQEAEVLGGVGSRRLAVPLSEVRWEREGVGGVVTKDGKSYIETKGKSRGPAARVRGTRDGAGGSGAGGGASLAPAQAALRRTAMMTVVQMIQGLEPALREVSGKSQDEWDGWLGKMMNDLVNENGTSWGECLEVGAWWARKKGRARAAS